MPQVGSQIPIWLEDGRDRANYYEAHNAIDTARRLRPAGFGHAGSPSQPASMSH